MHPLIEHPHLLSAPPRFGGLYRGSVVDNDDTTHRGRIKVTVPTVFEQVTPDAAVWAVPCFPYGHVYLPEVGDKVWVAFEDGDPATPVWLGMWFASGGMPTHAAVSPPVKRLIHSKSGHEVLLDDSAGQEQVVVTDKGGSKVTLNAQGVSIQTPGTPSGHSIVLDSTPAGNQIVVTDKTGSTITLAPTAVTIQAAPTLGGGSISFAVGGLTIAAPTQPIVIRGASVDVQVG